MLHFLLFSALFLFALLLSARYSRKHYKTPAERKVIETELHEQLKNLREDLAQSPSAPSDKNDHLPL